MRDQGLGIVDWANALQSNLHRLASNFKINEPLARYTTSRLGGPADVLIEATSAAELKDIVIAARQVELPILMLGGGANVLVSDAGVRGLTIINKAKRIEFRADNVVWCEAGTVLPTLARECIALAEARTGRFERYGHELSTLIGDWRSAWGEEFPFLVVQLANLGPLRAEPADSSWARVREHAGTA